MIPKLKTEFDNVGNNVQVYLEKQFPDCTNVKFEVTAPVFDDLLKYTSRQLLTLVWKLLLKIKEMECKTFTVSNYSSMQTRKSSDDLDKSLVFFIARLNYTYIQQHKKIKGILYTLC